MIGPISNERGRKRFTVEVFYENEQNTYNTLLALTPKTGFGLFISGILSMFTQKIQLKKFYEENLPYRRVWFFRSQLNNWASLKTHGKPFSLRTNTILFEEVRYNPIFYFANFFVWGGWVNRQPSRLGQPPASRRKPPSSRESRKTRIPGKFSIRLKFLVKYRYERSS